MPTLQWGKRPTWRPPFCRQKSTRSSANNLLDTQPTESPLPPNVSYQIVPLGGVGEIGSNMALLMTPTETLVIDAGILFPDDTVFGINHLVPDLSQTNKNHISTLIITHGHEDHIGAVA